MKTLIVVSVLAYALTMALYSCSKSHKYDDLQARYDALLQSSGSSGAVHVSRLTVIDNDLHRRNCESMCMTNDMFILRNVKRKRFSYIPFTSDLVLEKIPVLYVKSGNSIAIHNAEYLEFDCGENHFTANYHCGDSIVGQTMKNGVHDNEIGPGMKFSVKCSCDRRNKGVKDPLNCYITFSKFTTTK